MASNTEDILSHISSIINDIENEEKSIRNDFDIFVETKWLKPHAILRNVILGHTYLESLVDKLLKKALIDSNKLKGYTFHKKIEILESIGIVSKNYAEKLFTLNTIRNRFAHNLEYEIPISLAKKFSDKKPDLDLYYRDSAVFISLEITQIAGYLSSAIACQRKIHPSKFVYDKKTLKKIVERKSEE